MTSVMNPAPPLSCIQPSCHLELRSSLHLPLSMHDMKFSSLITFTGSPFLFRVSKHNPILLLSSTVLCPVFLLADSFIPTTHGITAEESQLWTPDPYILSDTKMNGQLCMVGLLVPRTQHNFPCSFYSWLKVGLRSQLTFVLPHCLHHTTGFLP